MKKNKYLVTVYEELYTTYVVEAEHEDEASDKALMDDCVSIYKAVNANKELILVENHE